MFINMKTISVKKKTLQKNLHDFAHSKIGPDRVTTVITDLHFKIMVGLSVMHISKHSPFDGGDSQDHGRLSVEHLSKFFSRQKKTCTHVLDSLVRTAKSGARPPVLSHSDKNLLIDCGDNLLSNNRLLRSSALPFWRSSHSDDASSQAREWSAWQPHSPSLGRVSHGHSCDPLRQLSGSRQDQLRCHPSSSAQYQ